MIFVLIFTLVIAGIWLYGFIQANDLSVPTKSISSLEKIKKVLIIFPHADDEANSTAGTITQLIKAGIEINWIVLTQGEKGTADAHYAENLKTTRTLEAQYVSQILQVKLLIQKDYPDKAVDSQKSKLTAELKQTITDLKPDLVVTYDQSGGYGHPDHIVVSRVATQLLKTDFPAVRLWYTSTPQKLFTKLSLPEHLAKDTDFKSHRKFPTFKIWVGFTGIMNKIKAIYAYNSQFPSFVKSVPIKQIPMWFYISLTPFEYFYEVK